MTRRRSYAAVRHNRGKIEELIDNGRGKRHNFRRSLNVKVEIQRNTSTIGAGGSFKALYTALACPISKGQHMPTNYEQLRKSNYTAGRGRRCGDGYGKTPTAAYSMALKNLAKIKR